MSHHQRRRLHLCGLPPLRRKPPPQWPPWPARDQPSPSSCHPPLPLAAGLRAPQRSGEPGALRAFRFSKRRKLWRAVDGVDTLLQRPGSLWLRPRPCVATAAPSSGARQSQHSVGNLELDRSAQHDGRARRHARNPSHSPFFFASRITACACFGPAPMPPQNSLMT